MSDQQAKYHLTLAEFPCFWPSARGRREPENLEYIDTIRGKNGVRIERIWRVFPHTQYGWGSPATLATFFALIQLWCADNYRSDLIYFGSINRLLSYMRLPNSRDYYKRIIADIKSLTGISIEAHNAYWNPVDRVYVDKYFNLFSQLHIVRPDGNSIKKHKISGIWASPDLCDAVQNNEMFGLTIPADVFFDLTPTEQRVALYLSKLFRSQKIHNRKLDIFCKQLLLADSTLKIAKKSFRRVMRGIKNKTDGLIDTWDLINKNNVDYVKIVSAIEPKKIPEKLLSPENKINENADINCIVDEIISVTGDTHSKFGFRKLVKDHDKEVIFRALSEVKMAIHDGKAINPGGLLDHLVKKKFS